MKIYRVDPDTGEQLEEITCYVIEYNDEEIFNNGDGVKTNFISNGLNHRPNNLPALIYDNNLQVYYANNIPHRTDGPAFGNQYYLNGTYYPDIKSDEEWIRFQKLIVFE